MIHVRQIIKTFESGRGHVKALQGVSFTVEAGKVLTILGKSGSGKTTLLNCVGGLEIPDQGTITCFGQELTKLPGRAITRFQRRCVGFVFQFANLLSYLTVSENIEFPLVLNGVARIERTERVARLLEQIGLPDAGRALPHELSGGELQRVSFARAIAHHPAMLLADEPTASLDSKTAFTLTDMMVRLSKEHACTLLIATHDPELVKVADMTLSLRDGQVVDEM